MNPVYSVEVYWQSQLVGKIALTDNGLCAFEYSAGFLQNGFSISPFELPLRSGVFIAKPHPFNGNFGVFDDCLPDGWGMIILERYLQKKGIKPRSINILDKLSLVGSTGRGALEFIPDQSVFEQNTIPNFDTLANEAQQILSSVNYYGDGVEKLYLQGGSPGGARPKVFVVADNKEWLVKFRSTYDAVDIGKTEYHYSLLAKKCGIEMPPTCLFDDKYFGVQRFDRTPTEKIHIVSVAGLLNADYRTPCIDYFAIFQLCSILTHNTQEMWKLYRLMVFNFLIENKDDHAKNFAFMYLNKEWKLTPAFDILASEGMNGYHTTSINDKIEPSRNDLIAVAVKAGLNKLQAEQIFDSIQTIISNDTH